MAADGNGMQAGPATSGPAQPSPEDRFLNAMRTVTAERVVALEKLRHELGSGADGTAIEAAMESYKQASDSFRDFFGIGLVPEFAGSASTWLPARGPAFQLHVITRSRLADSRSMLRGDGRTSIPINPSGCRAAVGGTAFGTGRDRPSGLLTPPRRTEGPETAAFRGNGWTAEAVHLALYVAAVAGSI
ncbi:hypothetical protein DFJ74DRAFT_434507 [Hyaloraphidium curvatum]|nr:hypothetical protein DFJ74DRAFT_434507 [Hyaloraphidium curvatum]